VYDDACQPSSSGQVIEEYGNQGAANKDVDSILREIKNDGDRDSGLFLGPAAVLLRSPRPRGEHEPEPKASQ
jgi:hypothetical protein